LVLKGEVSRAYSAELVTLKLLWLAAAEASLVYKIR
jgi:hypothetical protein